MQTQEPINGHAAETPPAAKPQIYTIRLFRVPAGGTVFVIPLTDSYGGLFTHYTKQGSALCTGNDCRHRLHGITRTWKGYAPAILHISGTKYMPVCLELTENLELDLRGVWARGQKWEIFRDHEGKGARSPVEGKLHDDQVVIDLPKPFDIIPCLRAIYHVDHIELNHANPMPPRVYVPAAEAPMPDVMEKKPDPKFVPPDGYSYTEEFRRRQKAMAEQKVGPTEQKPPYKR